MSKAAGKEEAGEGGPRGGVRTGATLGARLHGGGRRSPGVVVLRRGRPWRFRAGCRTFKQHSNELVGKQSNMREAIKYACAPGCICPRIDASIYATIFGALTCIFKVFYRFDIDRSHLMIDVCVCGCGHFVASIFCGCHRMHLAFLPARSPFIRTSLPITCLVFCQPDFQYVSRFPHLPSTKRPQQENKATQGFAAVWAQQCLGQGRWITLPGTAFV